VPVEDPDPFPADAGREMAGQLAEAGAPPRGMPRGGGGAEGELGGGGRGGGAEPNDDLVGAFDDVVVDVAGIGATTPGGLVLRGQLGFHVALDGVVGQDRLAYCADVWLVVVL